MASKTEAKRPVRIDSKNRAAAAFSVADVLDDFAAAYALLDSRQLDEYSGQLVAVLHGAVVGSDAVQLRRTASRVRKVHPERIAIIRVRNESTAYVWSA